MENRQLLKRSSKGLWVQILSGGAAAFLIGVFVTWLISVIFNWTTNGGLYTVVFMWAVFLGGWAIGSLKLWLDWNIKRYEIAEDALIVHAKAGSWGSTQTIYRYESIITLRMTQGFFGKKFGYGDVHITIPKIDQPVVMNDVIDPINQILSIQKRMGERSSGATHSLIN